MVHTAYVAGRISRQDEVREIVQTLRKRGFTITLDWSWQEQAMTPKQVKQFRKDAYTESNREKHHQEAEDDIKAVLEADVFIILTDTSGSSMYVELGVAFAAQKLTGRPQRLYAIGPHTDRLYFWHNGITCVDSVNDVLVDLGRTGLVPEKLDNLAESS